MNVFYQYSQSATAAAAASHAKVFLVAVLYMCFPFYCVCFYACFHKIMLAEILFL